MKQETKKKATILYVDDEAFNLLAFKAAFRRYYNIFTAESAAEGMEILEKEDIEIVLTDQRMPKITGIEFLQSIIKTHPDTIRILVTGYANIDAVIDAINKGQVYKYIAKPWDNEYLRITIDNAFEVFNLRKEKEDLTARLLDANEKLEFMIRQKLIS